jgi:hypothetical protein
MNRDGKLRAGGLYLLGGARGGCSSPGPIIATQVGKLDGRSHEAEESPCQLRPFVSISYSYRCFARIG